MKIIVGVDSVDRVKVIGQHLKALNFSKADVELVHVLERLAQTEMPSLAGTQADIIARYWKLQEEEAKNLLVQSQNELKSQGLPTATKLLDGFSSNRVISYSEETGANLMALGHSGKGQIEQFLVGSVSRKALVSAKCSMLMAKRPLNTSRPLTVVLATDHSPYANRWLQQFAGWAPQGIGRAVLTTVFPAQLVKAMASVVENFKADVTSWITDELHRKNAEVLEALKPLKTQFSSRVESGNVGDSLQRVMEEESADLLVLGAQGHGFVERMMIGSVSLDQAMRRPYSVLIVRAGK